LGKNVENISTKAFSGCENINNELKIPSSVKTIGDCAFENCGSLEYLDIGENVEYIGDNAFSSCKSLTGTIALPDKVRYIGHNAFKGCLNINEIVWNGVTYWDKDDFNAAVGQNSWVE
jgi:hypothetical protein